MEVKFLEDDEGWYVVKKTIDYKCGYQIIRGPFHNKPLADKGLDQFQRTGCWPGPKFSTEQDV